MIVSRRAWLTGFGATLATPVLAQDSWPTRSIRLLVGYPAGGANDLVMRGIAAPLGDALGQPVLVENRAGAAGGIAAEAAARAAPDGYTLFSISSAHVLAPSVRRTLNWDPVRDFAPIALGARSPYFLMVHKDFPAQNVAEFVAYVKSRPTGSISYASSGVGAGPHLTTSLFMHVTGIALDHIPYRGDADALIDLTTGRVPCAFLSVAPALPHIAAGSIRVLAVSGTERLSILPDVPTVAESGYPGFAMDAWWGICGPAGLPAPIVQRVAAAMRPILDAPAFAERYAAIGVVPGKLGTEAFTQLIRDDRTRFDRIVRDAGIAPQD
ncbi:tripartite tricarboxylate transporter substrate binding protein [Roseomonas terrae]|jgi:tripartite-type tricarboxylate transporter receptor subunit TctC|uniref:Tripartite tricarboxylate transporter substrate binding protein n=1 Tax=Neoroseomonas terrae TaxID=424799 RepID=A0ABS5EGE2_9PROT|nr:tripartite tricarboxylate transporter substrate-binding protein [Neoroseomonas terrae]MBR0650088.1 tripartite tricarboxylate transporter substrate binding protein [Neoroseomonas terrae]